MQSDLNNPMSSVSQLSERGDLAVTLVSIDRYVETPGLEKLDFVKIDVEGAEDRVIRGMTKTSQRFRPDVLVEIHANDGRKCEGLVLLKEAGFQLLRVEMDGLFAYDTRAQGGHVLGLWHP